MPLRVMYVWVGGHFVIPAIDRAHPLCCIYYREYVKGGNIPEILHLFVIELSLTLVFFTTGMLLSFTFVETT